jgi:peptidoglycan/xylan/chitin deacetylase (PgdA/CDA1 family)
MKPPLILLYHGLGRVPHELDPSNLIVNPEGFREQVVRLKKRGYYFVTVSDFARRIDAKPPRKLCAITFDDGSADNAHVLRDLLEELDVPATIYICPGLLGDPHPFLLDQAGIRLMNLRELQSVAAHPLFEIGAHTNTHVNISRATREEAYKEMVESKAALEEYTGAIVPTFAYPAGGFSQACPAAAEQAGFVAAVTCGKLGSWRPYELRREAIHAYESAFSFELKAQGLYRPLYSPPGRLALSITRPLRRVLRGLRRDSSPIQP